MVDQPVPMRFEAQNRSDRHISVSMMIFVTDIAGREQDASQRYFRHHRQSQVTFTAQFGRFFMENR